MIKLKVSLLPMLSVLPFSVKKPFSITIPLKVSYSKGILSFKLATAIMSSRDTLGIVNAPVACGAIAVVVEAVASPAVAPSVTEDSIASNVAASVFLVILIFNFTFIKAVTDCERLPDNSGKGVEV